MPCSWVYLSRDHASPLSIQDPYVFVFFLNSAFHSFHLEIYYASSLLLGTCELSPCPPGVAHRFPHESPWRLTQLLAALDISSTRWQKTRCTKSLHSKCISMLAHIVLTPPRHYQVTIRSRSVPWPGLSSSHQCQHSGPLRPGSKHSPHNSQFLGQGIGLHVFLPCLKFPIYLGNHQSRVSIDFKVLNPQNSCQA